jgi:hypothetical protein
MLSHERNDLINLILALRSRSPGVGADGKSDRDSSD